MSSVSVNRTPLQVLIIWRNKYEGIPCTNLTYCNFVHVLSYFFKRIHYQQITNILKHPKYNSLFVTFITGTNKTNGNTNARKEKYFVACVSFLLFSFSLLLSFHYTIGTLSSSSWKWLDFVSTGIVVCVCEVCIVYSINKRQQFNVKHDSLVDYECIRSICRHRIVDTLRMCTESAQFRSPIIISH